MRRQVELLSALVETSNRPSVSVVQPIYPPLTVTPKASLERESRWMDTCIKYLKDNPNALALTGRVLADTVMFNGRSVSYKTWNEAKKKL